MSGKNLRIAGLLLLFTGCTTTLTQTPPKGPVPAPFKKPQASKVVLIIFENKNADPVRKQSFFGKLASEGPISRTSLPSRILRSRTTSRWSPAARTACRVTRTSGSIAPI